MTPEQFLTQVRRGELEPAYLFLGAEPYRRQLCRTALIGKMAPEGVAAEGFTEFDLAGTTLATVIDDACSMSLFSLSRLIWVVNAEAALPRGRSSADEADAAGQGAFSRLSAYLRSPSPGVVLVFEASRYSLEGEDKPKAERVAKAFSSIPARVEFPAFTAAEVRQIAHQLARQSGLAISREVLELLVESVGTDAMRVAVEIEKLSLYAASGAAVGPQELAALVPDSSVSTVFALVDAMARRDRVRALALLDTLLRQGEYMPLALSFLAGLFRMALIAKELGLRSPHAVQQAFSKPGRPIWRSRAEQICQTATLFSKRQLEDVLQKIAATDVALRDVRPDDRIVMERLILSMTA